MTAVKAVRWICQSCSAYCSSSHFVSGTQLCVGVLIVSLFAWFRSISWPGFCLAGTLVAVGNMLIAQNNTLGARTTAAAMLIGPSWVGCLTAGVVGSIAKPITSEAGYVTTLCILSIIALAILTGPRAARPPHFIGYGILLSLLFASCIISGQGIRSIDTYWRDVVSRSILTTLLSAGAVILSATLVAPSLSGSQLQRTTAAIMHNVGNCAGSVASMVLVPSTPAVDEAACEASVLEALQQEESMDFLLALEELIKPPPSTPLKRTKSLSHLLRRHTAKTDMGETSKSRPVKPPSPPRVASLRPQLQAASLLVASAAYEPPQLQLQRMDLDEWRAVISALQLVITRLASLEGVLHIGTALASVNDKRIQYLFKLDVVGRCRHACGTVAAACHSLAESIEHPPRGAMAGCRLVVGPVWQELHDELLGCLKGAVASYWQRFVGEQRAGRKPMIMVPIIEFRSMVYLGIVMVGLLDAMDSLEQAVVRAVVGKQRGSCPRSGANSPCYANRKEVVVNNPCVDWRRRLRYHLGWMVNVVKTMLAVEVFMFWWQLYVKRVPAALRGWGSIQATLRDRWFQFWFKCWVAYSVLLCVIIGLQVLDNPSTWNMQFAFMALVIAFDKKVETTVNKAIFRLLGTWVGGSLGFWAMSNVDVATNPYVLATLVGVFSFVFGHLGPFPPFRIAVVMAVSAFNAPILCQYNGVDTGTIKFYVCMIINFTVGAVYTVIFNQLVLPWYTTTSALHKLGMALEHMGDFMVTMYCRFYDEGHHAALASGTALHALVRDDSDVDPLQASAISRGPSQALEEQAPPPQKLLGHPAQLVTPDDGIAIALSQGELEATSSWHSKAVGRLQAQVAGPLVTVQLLLLKDTTIWKHGLLAMPQVVPDLLRQQLSALDVLASLELTLAYGPSTTGRFTGTMLPVFGLTLDKMIVVLRLCRTLVCEASLLLQCYDPARHARVVSLQEELNEARVQARATYIACRNRLHRDMVATTSLEERMGVMNIDDAVRFQSFMWALISAVNQVQVCCNVVLRQCRDKGPLVIPFI